jgi:hypothetical protein
MTQPSGTDSSTQFTELPTVQDIIISLAKNSIYDLPAFAADTVKQLQARAGEEDAGGWTSIIHPGFVYINVQT